MILNNQQRLELINLLAKNDTSAASIMTNVFSRVNVFGVDGDGREFPELQSRMSQLASSTNIEQQPAMIQSLIHELASNLERNLLAFRFASEVRTRNRIPVNNDTSLKKIPKELTRLTAQFLI